MKPHILEKCLGHAIGASLMIFCTNTASAGTPEPTFSHVAYAFDHFKQHLDVYLPESFCGPRPTVIFIHGGGWLSGDKSQVAPHVESLLARGFAVASIDYRLSNNFEFFPAQIHDCKSAMRFLRANAEEFSLDPDRFAVFGDSAGAYLCALLGTSGDVAALEGTTGGNLSFSSRVQAVGDFYGPIDLWDFGATYPACDSSVSLLFDTCMGDVIENISNPAYADLVALINSSIPQNYISVDDPPFWIVHRAEDDTVPSSQSVDFHNALVAGGVTSSLTLPPGTQHSVPQANYQEVFDAFEIVLAQPAPIVGDTDCDGDVDVDDYTAVITDWGDCVKGEPCSGDVNDDGTVNIDDFTLVILHWT